MSWYTSGQNDQNTRYWLLDSSHGSYETRRAAIESLSPNYANVAGSVANTRVVTGYATDAEIASNSLDIGGAVLDRVHNYVNAYASIVTINTYTYGAKHDKYPVWGEFLQQPLAIPTTGIDALVQQWKDGLKSVKYIDQSGTGDGSSYANRRKIADFLVTNTSNEATVDLAGTDIVVLCGTLSRFRNEGAGPSIFIPSGTSGDRAIVLSHPTDPCHLMAGAKIGGGGSGEDSDWTSDGGGMWHIDVTLGAAEFIPGMFVMSDAGWTRRPITRVADSTAVAATSDSVAFGTSGGKDRIWVRLADGSNPRTTTYFGGYTPGGVRFRFNGAEYFDVFGVKTYLGGWLGTAFHGDNFGAYACEWWYGGAYYFTGGQGSTNPNEGTGLLTSTDYAPQNRTFQGCKVAYFLAAFYDSNGLGEICPTGTLIRDCVIEKIGVKAADAYGVELGSGDDTHALATMTCKQTSWINNSIRYCAHVPVFHYAVNSTFATPTGGPETETLYTDYWPSSRWHDNGDGTQTYFHPMRDILIDGLWIRDIITEVENPALGITGRGIQLGGDGDAGYECENVIVRNCRIEGNFDNGAIVTKWKPAGGADTTQQRIYNNVIRGAAIGLNAFGESAVGGNTYEPTFEFTGNDVHALTYFCEIPNNNDPDFHKQLLNTNTYRNDDAAIWRAAGATTYATIALWRAGAPTGDTYDNDSTHVAGTTDTGSPTLTTTGGPNLNATLTASLGSDPDGSTSSLSYQWFRNGALISGATSSTYAATTANGNAAGDDITLVILGTDAKGKWFLVTSDTVTLEGQGVPTPAPTIVGHGGIPLSEDEYYRKQKKNRPVVDDMDVAPQPVQVAVYTGVIERPKPPILRSSPELKASLERAEQIARERPKKRNRRKDDDWLILN